MWSEVATMLSCQQLTELVTDYFEGRLGLGQRLRLRWHLWRCAPCRIYLAQMRLTVRVLGAVPPESISADVRASLLQGFRDAMAAQPHPRPRGLWPGGLAVACDRLLGAWKGWLVAATVLAVLALAAVFVTAGPGPLGHGGKCVLIELATAAVPIAALVGLALASHNAMSTGVYAAGGCVGSLVGYAHVQAHCALSRALPHALLFHVGGVLAAVVLAAGVAMVVARLAVVTRPRAL